MSNLFRKKSLEHISSPEQLNAYIRVSTPSVWLLLSAIVVLLLGVCIWGVFGRMETALSVVAVCREGVVTAYVREMDADKVQPDAKATVADTEGKVMTVSAEPLRVDESFTEYMCHLGGLQAGEWVYEIALEVDCEDGVHAAQIVIDSVSPMSFVMN